MMISFHDKLKKFGNFSSHYRCTWIFSRPTLFVNDNVVAMKSVCSSLSVISVLYDGIFYQTISGNAQQAYIAKTTFPNLQLILKSVNRMQLEKCIFFTVYCVCALLVAFLFSIEDTFCMVYCTEQKNNRINGYALAVKWIYILHPVKTAMIFIENRLQSKSTISFISSISVCLCVTQCDGWLNSFDFNIYNGIFSFQFTTKAHNITRSFFLQCAYYIAIWWCDLCYGWTKNQHCWMYKVMWQRFEEKVLWSKNTF